VVVNAEGIFWRGWGRFTGERWSEIIAIGRPPSDAGRFDDERIHVVTEDDYRFIHGFNMRRRDEALEAMRAWGGFAESKRLGSYSFICRRDRIGEIEERSREHIGTEIDKPYRFWAGRFRRF
jgi:hypothetical protein